MRCLYASVNVWMNATFVWKCIVVMARWPVMIGGRKRASAPFSQSYLSFPWNFCECFKKLIRGCIGSSSNVRVDRLAIRLPWWNMRKVVFPGEWRLYVKSLQLSIWSSFKVSCLGYPYHIHTYKKVTPIIHFLVRKSPKIQDL